MTTLAAKDIDWVGYVEDAVDLVEAEYYDPGSVDWGEVRRAALAVVEPSPSQEMAHRAIREVFGERGVLDSHSIFITPGQPSSAPASLDPPTGERLEEGVGYLQLPAVATTGEHFLDYAGAAHEVAGDIDEPAVCGWIVDLRDNLGGNMRPILLGVGPLLGEEDFLAFAKLGEEPTGWVSYQDGRLLVGGEPLDFGDVTVERAEELRNAFELSEPFEPADPDVPVAVLMSGLTSSSGELTVVAFKGRPQTRFFGEPTGGYTTAVSNFLLEDGAFLRLSTGVAVDRLGNPYVGSIQPDEAIMTSFITDDIAKQRATQWLLEQDSHCG